MSGRSDKEQASMDAKITLLCTFRLLFLSHVDFVLIIYEVDNRCPRVAVVDIVTKSRSVNDSEFDLERLLFQFCFDDVHLQDPFKVRQFKRAQESIPNLYLSKLVELLDVSAVVVFGRREFSRKESIDQG